MPTNKVTTETHTQKNTEGSEKNTHETGKVAGSNVTSRSAFFSHPKTLLVTGETTKQTVLRLLPSRL